MLLSTAYAAPFAHIKSNNDNTASTSNSVNNFITTTINVGTNPTGVAVSPDGTKVYVTNLNDDTVSVINTKTNTVTATVPVGSNPSTIAGSPDGTKVYVTNSNDNTISVIDTSTNTTELLNSDSHKFGSSKMKASLSKHKQKNHTPKHHKTGKNHLALK